MDHVLAGYLPYQLKRYPERAPPIRRAVFSIKSISKKISSCQTRQELLLVEARATNAYWKAVALLTKQAPDWRRVHPHASDPLNTALNIGYTILANVVREAVKRHGLDPSIGMLHEPHDGKEALVYDLEELFRQPVVDAAIIPLFTRRNHADQISSKTIVSGVAKHFNHPTKYRRRWWMMRDVIDQEIVGYLSAIVKDDLWQPCMHSWSHHTKNERLWHS